MFAVGSGGVADGSGEGVGRGEARHEAIGEEELERVEHGGAQEGEEVQLGSEQLKIAGKENRGRRSAYEQHAELGASRGQVGALLLGEQPVQIDKGSAVIVGRYQVSEARDERKPQPRVGSSVGDAVSGRKCGDGRRC